MAFKESDNFVHTDPYAGFSERMLFKAKGKFEMFGNHSLDATETE